MTRADLNRYLCVLLSTLAESSGGGTSEGHVYLAFGASGAELLDDLAKVLAVAEEAGLITRSPSRWIELTPKGRGLGDDVNARLAAAKKEKTS